MTSRKPFYRSLYFQVIVAILLGVLLGHFWPQTGASLKPLGDAFIKLVKMIIAPVIFLTIVTGIAGMSQLSTVGRVFGKAMAYFLFFSTLALVVGLVVANVVQPGAGMNINPADLDQTAVKGYVAKSHEMTLTGFALDIIPKTLVSPFVGDNILQVLLVAVLFGIGLAMVGEPGRPVLNFLEALTTPVFKVVGIVMKVAPIGAFGAMAFTIGKFGLGSLVNLAWLVGEGWAKRLILCGERVTAQQALQIGLVEEVVPKGTAREAALALAEKVARQSPVSVTACKQLIQRGRNQPMFQALPAEREAFVDLFDSQDQAEGVQAFLQKRPPQWHNR